MPDAVVLGGGHNGLAAAAYLARAGRSVLLLERAEQLGGATRSAAPFAGVDVRLSRYSYLVALLPRLVIEELGLRVVLLRRAVASYTPPGLLVRAGEDPWPAWSALVERLAAAVRPTLTQPLPAAAELRRIAGQEAWEALVERPLGEALEALVEDDLARGTILTDGLIGTASHAHDPSLAQNRCLLLHALGRWDVPAGGMGTIAAELARVARESGADLRTRCDVVAVGPDGEVRYADADGREHAVRAGHVLAAIAPAALDTLRTRSPGPSSRPQGSQLKVNLVVDRLPRLKDGTPPEEAFAGTFHAGEGYARLQEAAREREAGGLPDPLPCELYCHTLTDPSILGPAERERGRHTLTLFGLHCPVDADRDAALAAALRAVDEHLAEPLLGCVARDADGRPCVEVATPRDVERDLAMPGGHIFHRDLRWPWAEDPPDEGTWGVATDDPRIVLAGAGARRGGGVSAIPGRAAALHVLGANG